MEFEWDDFGQATWARSSSLPLRSISLLNQIHRGIHCATALSHMKLEQNLTTYSSTHQFTQRHCTARQCAMAQQGTAQHSTAQHSPAPHSTASPIYAKHICANMPTVTPADTEQLSEYFTGNWWHCQTEHHSYGTQTQQSSLWR